MGKGTGILAGILIAPLIVGATIAAVPKWRNSALDWISKHSDIYKTAIANNEALQEENDNLQQDNEDLQGDVSSWRTQYNELFTSKTQLQAQVTTLTNDKTTLQNQVTTLTNDKTGLQAQVTALTNDKTTLQTQLASQEEQITTLNTRVDELLEQAHENNEFQFGQRYVCVNEYDHPDVPYGVKDSTFIIVNENGTGVMQYYDAGNMCSDPFTYEINENIITVSFGGEDVYTYELTENNTIKFTEEDEEYVQEFVPCSDELYESLQRIDTLEDDYIQTVAYLRNANYIIDSLNQQIANKDLDIIALQSTIENKDLELIALNEQVAILNARITELENQQGQNSGNYDVTISSVTTDYFVGLGFNNGITRGGINCNFDTDNKSFVVEESYIDVNQNFNLIGGSNDNVQVNSYSIDKRDSYSMTIGNQSTNADTHSYTNYNVTGNGSMHLYLNGVEYSTLDELRAAVANDVNYIYELRVEFYCVIDEYNNITSYSYNQFITSAPVIQYTLQYDVTYQDETGVNTYTFASDGTYTAVQDGIETSGTYEEYHDGAYIIYSNNSDFETLEVTSDTSFEFNGITYTIQDNTAGAGDATGTGDGALIE